VFSTDQTHLRRYLTTLGIAVAAGTLSLAGLFLKLEQDLLVTKSTLTQLTPTARTALLERQRYLAIGTSILPYFCLVGFLGGLSLAAYGMIGWRQRQRVTDELENLALEKGRVEFRQMTAEEQVEKLNREAEESADIASASASRGSEYSPQDRERVVSTVRNRSMILETSLLDKLKEALGLDSVQAYLHASTPGGRVEVDALARRGKQNIVFELKYAADTKSASIRIRDAFMQLSRGVRAVQAAGADSVSGVAVIVLPDTTGPSDLWRFAEEADDISASFKSNLRALVMRYSDFLSITPGDLAKRLFGGNDGTSGQAA
jgi:hypothetical protein